MATGIFMGLNTAVQGLMASQVAVETASHNIDNANTPGYSRQQVNLSTTPALEEWGLSSNGPGYVGTGVQISDITRLRNAFLDAQYRDQNQALGQSQVQQDTLNQVTGIINEPSDTGISNALQKFWSAWDNLQSNPSELSARTQVQQTGMTLTQTMNQTANQLSSLYNNETTALNSRTTQTNSLLSQVANLNQQIHKQQSMPGGNPNDLLDQRDELLDQLSQLGSVSVTQTPTSYQVSLGGTVVVSNGHAATLSASGNSIQATTYDATTDTFPQTTPATNTTITSPGGELGGTLDGLTSVSGYQTELDNLAQALAGTSTQGQMNVTLPGSWSVVTSAGGTPTFPVSGTLADGSPFTAGEPVTDFPQISLSTSGGYTAATVPAGATVAVNGINGLQEIGYSEDGPGQAFFTSSNGQPIDASNISVGVTPTGIAAGTSVQPGTNVAMAGDGTLAGAVSGVKDQTTSFINPADPTKQMQGTVSDFLQAIVSELGVQGQTANNAVTYNQALVQQVNTQRQSVSGVSIDEEMTNIVQAQQAYNGSAKVIETINEMLQTLIDSV